MKSRVDYRFKILYAIGMIMVVCGHCNGGGINFLINDWFPFQGLHLALFVFCSGYFFKEISIGGTGKYIVKKIKRLIIPLYLYTLAYGIFVQVTKIFGFTIGDDFTLKALLVDPIFNGHEFMYNMGGWFIAPLFMVEVFNVAIRKLLRLINKDMPEIVFFIIGILLGIAGNALACNDYLYGAWITLIRVLYFMPFYELGIFYKKCLEEKDKLPSFWYFSIIFVIRAGIILIYGRNLYYTVSWANDFTDGPVMPIVVGFLGIALWMRIATIMEPMIGRSKWINYIADNTYSIMMNQFLGFMLIKGICGIISKLNIAFPNFDWTSFKTDIWYYYVPRGQQTMLIIYLFAGIAVPIVIQIVINYFKSIIGKIGKHV